jgi:hypothetical protein
MSGPNATTLERLAFFVGLPVVVIGGGMCVIGGVCYSMAQLVRLLGPLPSAAVGLTVFARRAYNGEQIVRESEPVFLAGSAVALGFVLGGPLVGSAVAVPLLCAIEPAAKAVESSSRTFKEKEMRIQEYRRLPTSKPKSGDDTQPKTVGEATNADSKTTIPDEDEDFVII